jgi:hypothetical protein
MKKVVAASASIPSPLFASVGAVANIIDRNTGTLLEVSTPAAATQVYQWWTIDLGAPIKIRQVIVQDWYETGGSDVAFEIRYSDVPFSATDLGTPFGSSFAATVYPTTQDTTRTGEVTARYWAFTRSGLFDNLNRIGATEMELYTDDFPGGII